MTIKLSLDEGNTWVEKNPLLIDERICCGYSCMTLIYNLNYVKLNQFHSVLSYKKLPTKSGQNDKKER